MVSGDVCQYMVARPCHARFIAKPMAHLLARSSPRIATSSILAHGWLDVLQDRQRERYCSGFRFEPRPQRLPIFHLILVGEVNPELSGTDSAILNQESGDSESCDSKVGDSLLNIDRPRFGVATLCQVSTHFCASRCGNSGDSRPANLGIVWFAICDSVPLRSLLKKPGVP